MSFRGRRLAELRLPAGTVWLLTGIAEAKGRQTLYTRQAPQILKALREMALVQSVDFLCIHPFRDGNGRVSRLLTLLALYQHGYEVGRYISLERLVEETRDDYYDVLQRSSTGWHDGRHDLFPWLNYLLTIVRGAYREFEERICPRAR